MVKIIGALAMNMDNNHQDTAKPIVRIVGLCKSFAQEDVLHSVDIVFPKGECTVVLGPSGSGKSVMLKHLLGLLLPDKGEVWFEDNRVDMLAESELAPIRRQFGYLFQNGALFDSMNVRENIAFPLREHTDLSADQRLFRVKEVLDMVGMIESISKMPAELSGGQQKRIALARAIVLQPKVVLYDEPTTGLDPIRADSINDLIIKLQRELSITSIVVTHDLASAFKIADSMVMLYDGRVEMTGTPQEFRQSSNEAVQRFLNAHGSGDFATW